MSPDELRGRLATAYPPAIPPADLAARAVRTAGRIRRRRAVVVAAAAALAVAIPLSVAAVAGPDRALPPAAPPCGSQVEEVPDQRVARTEAEVNGWGRRGDATLRARAEQVAWPMINAKVIALHATEVSYGRYAAVLAEDTGTLVQPRSVWAVTWRQLPGERPRLEDFAAGRLPVPGPDAAISLLVRWPAAGSPGPGPATNLIVALAPPGSRSVTLDACRVGQSVGYGYGGDVLVADAGSLDGPGRITVRKADGTTGYVGPVGNPGAVLDDVQLPPVQPVPVPAGTREIFRTAGQTGTIAPGGVRTDRGTLFVRCRAPEFHYVFVARRQVGQVDCDGSVELVAENVPISGSVSLGDADKLPPSVVFEALVVVAN